MSLEPRSVDHAADVRRRRPGHAGSPVHRPGARRRRRRGRPVGRVRPRRVRREPRGVRAARARRLGGRQAAHRARRPLARAAHHALLRGGGDDRIRLGTNILLAALRRPVVLAKTAATLDVLSGGRLDLGVGVGWQREEYEAAGLDFDGRGRAARPDARGLPDAVARAARRPTPATAQLRAASTRCPSPLQPGGVPIWVSGTVNAAVLRRLARFGSGWIPWGRSASDLAAAIPEVRAGLEQRDRDPSDLRVVGYLPVVRGDDGKPDLDRSMDALRALVDIGVTDFRAGFAHPRGTRRRDRLPVDGRRRVPLAPPAGRSRGSSMTTVLPHRALGASGINVSVLSLGSWMTFEHMSREDGLAVMRAAREAGIDFLDDARYDDRTGTAPIPTGYSEVRFGELFRESGWRRDDAVVANKLWLEFWPDESPAAELDASPGADGLRRPRSRLLRATTRRSRARRSRRCRRRARRRGQGARLGCPQLVAVARCATRAALAQELGVAAPCAAQLPYNLVTGSPSRTPRPSPRSRDAA